MNLSQPLLYALASTIAEDMSDGEHSIVRLASAHVDYEVTANTAPVPFVAPCPACQVGMPGDVGEFEFTATLFGLDIDLAKLSQFFYDELERAIMDEIVS